MNKTQVSVLAILFVAAALAGFRLLSWPAPPASTVSQAVNPPKAMPAEISNSSLPSIQPPDLRELAGRLGAGTVPPTPEQIAEERRVEREQVAVALASLRSADADERVGGAQQLGAYPTREAEQRLAEALAGDKSGAVRAAAAQSLAFVKEPRSRGIKALLRAVLEGDPEVRAAALDTLQGYLNGLDPESQAFRQVRKGLAGLAGTERLDRETRATLRELLADFPG